MSFAEMRLTIATALNAVPDIHGYAYRPAGPAAGDAWPVLGPLERTQGTSFSATWRVRVVLPADEEAASAWVDDHWPALFYALNPHAFVQRALPVMLPAAGGDLYALEITMIGEE